MTTCNTPEPPHGFLGHAFAMASEPTLFDGIGCWIASGKFADIHELDDGRVIRIARCSSYDWAMYSKTLKRMQRRPHPSVVRVYAFGKIGEREHEEFEGETWVYYYTVTERLQPITCEREGEAVCMAIDDALNTSIPREVDGIIPRRKVIRIRKTFRRFPYSHVDLHWGNVMKDSRGNYKLIDLDSLE